LHHAIWTIAPENRFLKVLARAVLDGFPLAHTDMPLSRWTILLPNRRSARQFEMLLRAECGRRALVLPRIQPIGDIDEETSDDDASQLGLSKTYHLHAILTLVMHWADTHKNLPLAQDILASPAQAFALAKSLQQLINTLETEDADLANLEKLYDLDLAGHRDNILSLLKLLSTELPQRLSANNMTGPAAHRNRMIRQEAARIASGRYRGPILAAGSTGTNPATRDLLQAIAQQPMGAVVLPGLDLTLDDIAWSAITPEHPQFAMKAMLQQWEVQRRDIQTLGAPQGARSTLVNLAMRPAAVADEWPSLASQMASNGGEALHHVELVEAADRPQEAMVIALRLRQHIEQSTGHAAVITPDRDLALRIAAELQRWNLTIDDSAGTSLARTGRAALLMLMLTAVQEKFSAESVLALLHHPAATFGLDSTEHLKVVRQFELVCYRGLPSAQGLEGLHGRIKARQAALAKPNHEHPLYKSMTEQEWQQVDALQEKLKAIFAPLIQTEARALSEHINLLAEALAALAPESETVTPADLRCVEVMEHLKQGSIWHPVLDLQRSAHSIMDAFKQDTLRPPNTTNQRLSLYGLAEARLIDAELVILGGLAESHWPAHPDTGPWLNRAMRDSIEVQQPEREIGVTAHDFAQGFCHPNLMISWPRRIANTPTTPARWVLRLRAVLAVMGVSPENHLTDRLPKLATALDSPRRFKPIFKPQARPPVAARPRHFSVSGVETLLRDSYAVYARSVLRLEPMPPLNVDVDDALRGSLIHAALQSWITTEKQVPSNQRLELLLSKGRAVLLPYADMPEVQHFWWPRFVRMAESFVATDKSLRAEAINSRAEIAGRLTFLVLGQAHTLTARADRIDILNNGDVQIIDYKSGNIPTSKQVQSGFSPQLTLEAEMVVQHAFDALQANRVQDCLYLNVGGLADDVEVHNLGKTEKVAPLARKHFEDLQRLLATYLQQSTAYVPRHNLLKDNDTSNFDHLSRRLEWQLRGQQR
jgi:ATP-dependent helicase/nuclease subunit B